MRSFPTNFKNFDMYRGGTMRTWLGKNFLFVPKELSDRRRSGGKRTWGSRRVVSSENSKIFSTSHDPIGPSRCMTKFFEVHRKRPHTLDFRWLPKSAMTRTRTAIVKKGCKLKDRYARTTCSRSNFIRAIFRRKLKFHSTREISPPRSKASLTTRTSLSRSWSIVPSFSTMASKASTNVSSAVSDGWLGSRVSERRSVRP